MKASEGKPSCKRLHNSPNIDSKKRTYLIPKKAYKTGIVNYDRLLQGDLLEYVSGKNK